MPPNVVETDRRRFIIYSAVCFVVIGTALKYHSYNSAGHAPPLSLVGLSVESFVQRQFTYIATHQAFVATIFNIVAVPAAFVWWQRDWVRRYPETAKAAGLHLGRAFGVSLGVLFSLGAVSSPGQAFAALTWVWDGPLFFVRIGFTEQTALVLTSIAFIGGALVAFELGKVIRFARIADLLHRQ